MAFFEGLVVGEDGEPLAVTEVGGESFYVVDDQGFRRHIPANEVDGLVLKQFVDQIAEHREEATLAVLGILGQDDLFTKAMVDATLSNIKVEQILGHRLPEETRQMLGMMGFRIVVDIHGEVVRIDMPGAAADWDGDDGP